MSPTERLRAYLKTHPKTAPVGLVLVEDSDLLPQAIEYARKIGIGALVFLDRRPGATAPSSEGLHLPCDAPTTQHFVESVNSLLPILSQRWVALTFQSERVLYPFCETRTISDLLTFVEEERRDAVYSTRVDLYPTSPELGLDWHQAGFDSAGYYSEPVFEDGEILERQTALFGGLRWRMEEHIPWTARRLDRACLFKAIPGRTVTPDLQLSDHEGRTRACPWHHSTTAAVPSFRTALSLARNPASARAAKDLTCPTTLAFDGTSQQLMDYGFMEPGQWF